MHQDAAIHHQAGTGYVAGIVGGEEDGGTGHVLGRAEAAHRHHQAAFDGGGVIDVVGADQARDDGVDAHTVGREIEGHGSGHGLDAAFGRVVGHVAAVRAGGAAARHVDDDTGAFAHHDVGGAVGAQVGALQVDTQHLVPPLLVALQKMACGVDVAGIVYEDIDGSEGEEGRIEQDIDLGFVGDVCRDGDGLSGGQGAGYFPGALFVQIIDHDAGAFGGETLGHGAADAVTGSGNDDYLIGKSTHSGRIIGWSLEMLDVTLLTDAARQQLDEQGYLALPELMSPDLLRALRDRVEELFAEEGAQSGSEFKQEPGARRLANLVNKGRIFEDVIVTPAVLECMAHVLGPQFKLSSVNVRSTNPYSEADQPMHCDSGALPDERGYSVCNSVWMLDDFTAENGATRMVPGSHRWRRLPPPEMYEAHPEQQLVTGAAGTVVVMNAHMWHGGTANRTAAPRRAMHVYYTRFDKPQQQYQKRWLSPEVQARVSPTARRILALDDPLNDELSATGSGMSGFMK